MDPTKLPNRNTYAEHIKVGDVHVFKDTSKLTEEPHREIFVVRGEYCVYLFHGLGLGRLAGERIDEEENHAPGGVQMLLGAEGFVAEWEEGYYCCVGGVQVAEETERGAGGGGGWEQMTALQQRVAVFYNLAHCWYGELVVAVEESRCRLVAFDDGELKRFTRRRSWSCIMEMAESRPRLKRNAASPTATTACLWLL